MKRILASGMSTAASSICSVSAGAVGASQHSQLHITGVYVEVGSSAAPSTASVVLRYGRDSSVGSVTIALCGVGYQNSHYIPFSLQCGFAEIVSPSTHVGGIRAIIYGK